MIPVSQAFLDSINSDHIIRTVVEVWPSGFFPDNPFSSGSLLTLPITGGTLRVDKQGAARRRVTLKAMIESETDSGSNYIPIDGNSTLAPISNELHIWQGCNTDAGFEYVKMGVLRITQLAVWDSGESIWLQVDGIDRSFTVQQRKFGDPYTVASGTDSGDAIRQIISPAIPWTQYDFEQTRVGTAKLDFEEGDDRWKAASDIATFNGMQLYYDYRGVLCLKSLPNIKALTDPVVTFREGEDSTLLQLIRRLDGADVFSRVTVIGRPVGSDVPFRADAIDDDPTSPTYINGPFGDVPMVVRSSYVLNEDDASIAAQDIFRNGQGLTENIEIQAISNPALQEDDVVSFKRDRANVNSSACYALSQLTFPLNAQDTMYCGASRQF
jgi:hypothetical protein